jgi:hypothetical protein
MKSGYKDGVRKIGKKQGGVKIRCLPSATYFFSAAKKSKQKRPSLTGLIFRKYLQGM